MRKRERNREREFVMIQSSTKSRRNDRGLTLINSTVTDPPRYKTFD